MIIMKGLSSRISCCVISEPTTDTIWNMSGFDAQESPANPSSVWYNYRAHWHCCVYLGWLSSLSLFSVCKWFVLSLYFIEGESDHIQEPLTWHMFNFNHTHSQIILIPCMKTPTLGLNYSLVSVSISLPNDNSSIMLSLLKIQSVMNCGLCLTA